MSADGKLPPGAIVMPIEPDPRVGVVTELKGVTVDESAQPEPPPHAGLWNRIAAQFMFTRDRIVDPLPEMAGYVEFLRSRLQRDGAVVIPDCMRLAVMPWEPSPVARFDAWAAEGAQDRPPPGRRPWGARWER